MAEHVDLHAVVYIVYTHDVYYNISEWQEKNRLYECQRNRFFLFIRYVAWHGELIDDMKSKIELLVTD